MQYTLLLFFLFNFENTSQVGPVWLARALLASVRWGLLTSLMAQLVFVLCFNTTLGSHDLLEVLIILHRLQGIGMKQGRH